MKLKDSIKKSLDWYNKQNPRQKRLINILIIVILINLFFTHIYKRQLRIRHQIKKELISLDSRFKEIALRFPNLDKEKKQLSKQQNNLDTLLDRLKQMERPFPTQTRVPQFLSELVRQAQGKINFISITPKPPKEKGLYSHLDIEMIVISSYADLINYVSRLETLPQFLSISDITLEKKKDESGEFIETKILLSTLLTEKIESREEPKDSIIIQEPSIVIDPFIRDLKGETSQVFTESLKLTGIIFRKEKSSAIINNNIYKIGDKIGNKTILQILKDRVVLTDGEKTYELNLGE